MNSLLALDQVLEQTIRNKSIALALQTGVALVFALSQEQSGGGLSGEL